MEACDRTEIRGGMGGRGGLRSCVGVHMVVVYGGAYGKVGRILTSFFTLRLVWGVESGFGMTIGAEINC